MLLLLLLLLLVLVVVLVVGGVPEGWFRVGVWFQEEVVVEVQVGPTGWGYDWGWDRGEEVGAEVF